LYQNIREYQYERVKLLGILLCYQKKEKVKLWAHGKTIRSLTMTAVICKAVAEKISNDNGLPQREALEFVLDSIREAQDSIM
jgi:hypothetical protein